MTFREILEALERVPEHLLDHEVELWRYDGRGDWVTLPVHDMVSPFSSNENPGDPEWGVDGDYYLSFESYTDKMRPTSNGKTAKTTEYWCKDDMAHRSELVHQATVRWQSFKDAPSHVPAEVELRLGGKAYEYVLKDV